MTCVRDPDKFERPSVDGLEVAPELRLGFPSFGVAVALSDGIRPVDAVVVLASEARAGDLIGVDALDAAVRLRNFPLRPH